MAVEDFRWEALSNRVSRLEEAKPEVVADRVDGLRRSLGYLEGRLSERIKSVEQAIADLDKNTDERFGSLSRLVLGGTIALAGSAITFALTITLGLVH